jgi:hypothetical protein
VGRKKLLQLCIFLRKVQLSDPAEAIDLGWLAIDLLEAPHNTNASMVRKRPQFGAASCRQAAFHTTSALSVANANPLVADSAGRFDGHNFALKRGHEDRPSTFRCWPHVDDNGCNWPLLKHHA